ncbi:hypothetical protein BDV41DRAFT_561566 [Aspergillus transmontanensis]|uniref:Uncharacterized protein n=1 Tax=Aspergillus transmontanensis TaxID=1034304 RepID=A0A5N6W9K8_9EURO|nr:hypothetical protein BDV41DRAFT_561566 [Aspergillus transmontanensis]
MSSAIASLKSNNPPEPGEEASTEAAQEEDVPSEGSQSVIQTLYEGPSKCHCCKNWVEEYPDDLRMAMEDQPETKRKALVLRMGKDHNDGKLLVLDSIIMQSPSLKKTLGELFDGFTGITASLKKELLYGLLSSELMDDINEIEDHVRQGMITYRLLWALFEPSSRIVTAPMLNERFLIVDSIGYDPKKGYFEVHAKCTDWDGKDFGYANIMLPIFQLLHGVHYRAYSGVMLWNNGNKKAEPRYSQLPLLQVDGRIVIDAESYLDSNPDESRDLDALDDDSIMPTLQMTEQLLLCNKHVRGYSLKLKRWGMFDVTKVTSITWNNDAFSHLMLPTGYKNLILSFVERQATSKKAFDDVIKGKGLGILMLLAVADRVRKPLYMLSAGELGQSAEDIENRLSDILQLTEKWDAVLLFDQCDVFLQERSVRHLAHNEIVAVFLRLLEYYRGILIMTSNRADIIDWAFKSRIHLILHYPEPVPQAKEQIWRQFVNPSNSQNTLTDGAYSRLAALPMNGRQIKNVVQIATLLAGQEKTVLGIDQIRIVLQATKEVDDEGI